MLRGEGEEGSEGGERAGSRAMERKRWRAVRMPSVGSWGSRHTWVCGVARWAGELFSRALSRASNLERACCRPCTTAGGQGRVSKGQAQAWGMRCGVSPPTRLTASQALVLQLQAGYAQHQLAVVSTWPTGSAHTRTLKDREYEGDWLVPRKGTFHRKPS